MLLVPGAVVTSAMLWLYTTFTATTEIWLIAVVQTVLSLGLAMSFTPSVHGLTRLPATAAILVRSAIVSTLQQVAGAAGIALMFTVMAAASATATESGQSAADAGAAGRAHAAFLVAAFLSLPCLSGRSHRKPADSIAEEVPTH